MEYTDLILRAIAFAISMLAGHTVEPYLEETNTVTTIEQPEPEALSFVSEEDITIGGWGVGDCVPVPGRGCYSIGEEDREFLLALAVYVRPEFHDEVIPIVACESGFDQFAENDGSSARGYLQFLDDWYNDPGVGGDWRDPWWQAIMFQNLIDNGGFSHWEQCI
jgi:hypothetical protein